MKKRLVVAAILVSAFVSGCASHSINQGKNLSASGIAYTDAVDQLLDVAADKLIDFDTAELKKSRLGSNPTKIINDKNQALLLLLAEIEVFRAKTRLLKTYFVNLQSLSNSSIKDDAGAAVESLSDSISKLNQKIEDDGKKEKLTDDQKEQIGALGGLVAKAIHGEKVRRALKRDAKIIAVCLAHHENQINNMSSILKDRFKAENDLYLNKKIISPYIDRSKTLGRDWDEHRKTWLKTQFVNEKLTTAKEAAKQLRGVWGDILAGKNDVNSLSALISDVNEFVLATKALKDASKKQQ